MDFVDGIIFELALLNAKIMKILIVGRSIVGDVTPGKQLCDNISNILSRCQFNFFLLLLIRRRALRHIRMKILTFLFSSIASLARVGDTGKDKAFGIHRRLGSWIRLNIASTIS